MRIIYRFTFPNGKVYIGQTNNFKQRLYMHKADMRKETDTPVYRALNKYGWDKVIKEIFMYCPDLLIDEIETHWISFYKNKNLSYNLESGGHKNKKLSDETKKKMSKAGKERWFGYCFMCEVLGGCPYNAIHSDNCPYEF